MQKERYNRLLEFVINNKTNCYRAFKLSIKHDGFKTEPGMFLVEKARWGLDYSVKTWSGDIYMSLWKAYKLVSEHPKNKITALQHTPTNDKLN